MPKKKATKKAVVKRVKAVSKKPTKKATAAKSKPGVKTKKVVKKVAKRSKAGAAKAATAATKIPVDEHCHLGKARVVDDWDAMLNQTNIGANNNKFYVIQLVQSGNKYYTWTRWGRVGEVGQSALLGSGTRDEAEKQFEKKFKSKTNNAWCDRGQFVAKSGKYALIEVERSAEATRKADEIEEKLRSLDQDAAKLQTKVEYAKSKLQPSVEKFVKLIFDDKMFRGAMASFDIDVKKMPLGQITKTQVQKGYSVLEDLEKAIQKRRSAQINELSSRFYTVIPHAFGRNVPPPISTTDLLRKKVDMLNVLNDIEIALGMQKATRRSKSKLQPNPADANYAKLKADLEWVDPAADEWELVETYMRNTSSSYYKVKLLDLFRVNRDGESQAFKAHAKIKERKLLWHGTNVAVVAAILGSGLRIMPHSGGRVGKGIYLASENGKSACYVGWSGKTGVMFLVEAALGKEHTITKDDWTLKAPPNGYDSIVARGQTEPDSTHDVERKFDGKKVVIPQGKPVKSKYKRSNFSQSEYLVYQENQVRIRYVLRVSL